jgi:hypothetical protein
MTCLSIVQSAAVHCSVAIPTTAVTNSDPTVQQLLAFSQDAGDEMAQRWTWPALRRPGALSGPGGAPSASPATITGDGSTVIFALPADWGRFSPSDVMTSSLYPTLTLSGPINEEDLLRLKQLPFTPLPSVWHLLRDPSLSAAPRYIEFYPAPASGEIISFVYGTLAWISSAGTLTSNWLTDADQPLIPEYIIRLGTVWRWKRAKGLSYAEEFAMCERTFDRMAGQQSQGRTIRMTTEPMVGEMWWPGTINNLTSYP